jgi:hypothetical protein
MDRNSQFKSPSSDAGTTDDPDASNDDEAPPPPPPPPQWVRTRRGTDSRRSARHKNCRRCREATGQSEMEIIPDICGQWVRRDRSTWAASRNRRWADSAASRGRRHSADICCRRVVAQSDELHARRRRWSTISPAACLGRCSRCKHRPGRSTRRPSARVTTSRLTRHYQRSDGRVACRRLGARCHRLVWRPAAPARRRMLRRPPMRRRPLYKTR